MSSLSSTHTGSLFDAVHLLSGVDLLSRVLRSISPALRRLYCFLFGYALAPSLDAPPTVFLLDGPRASVYSNSGGYSPVKAFVPACILGSIILLVFGFTIVYRFSRSRTPHSELSPGIQFYYDTIYDTIDNPGDARSSSWASDDDNYEEHHLDFISGIDEDANFEQLPPVPSLEFVSVGAVEDPDYIDPIFAVLRESRRKRRAARRIARLEAQREALQRALVFDMVWETAREARRKKEARIASPDNPEVVRHRNRVWEHDKQPKPPDLPTPTRDADGNYRCELDDIP